MNKGEDINNTKSANILTGIITLLVIIIVLNCAILISSVFARRTADHVYTDKVVVYTLDKARIESLKEDDKKEDKKTEKEVRTREN